MRIYMKEIFCTKILILTCIIVHVKLKIRYVHQPGILVQVHHLRIESREMQHVFGETG